MLASWTALIVLFLIQGLTYTGDVTIKVHTLGVFYVICAVVIIVDLFYAHRGLFK